MLPSELSGFSFVSGCHSKSMISFRTLEVIIMAAHYCLSNILEFYFLTHSFTYSYIYYNYVKRKSINKYMTLKDNNNHFCYPLIFSYKHLNSCMPDSEGTSVEAN